MVLKNQIRVGNTRKPDNGVVAMGNAAFYKHAILCYGTVI